MGKTRNRSCPGGARNVADQELFTGSSLLTAVPKVSAQEAAGAHISHCHPGPQGDQRWRHESTPQTGELVAQVSSDMGTVVRKRYKHVPKYTKVKRQLSCRSSLSPPMPPFMAAGQAPARQDSVCRAGTSTRRISLNKIFLWKPSKALTFLHQFR